MVTGGTTETDITPQPDSRQKAQTLHLPATHERVNGAGSPMELQHSCQPKKSALHELWLQASRHSV